MNLSKELMHKYAYIWLSRVLGPGNAKSFEIMESFCGAENICTMSEAELKSTGVFTPTELKRAKNSDKESILKTIDYCENKGIRIITPLSEEYPPGFGFIEAPPLVIYARGEKLLRDAPYFAIVGARRATDFGLKAGYSLSARLTGCGFVIVSGGAKGIDGMAHRGAIAAGGKTVAVLGSGLDSDYLKANEELRKRISKNGTVISELEPKAPAGKHTFPVRNRLISALSLGVAVIEAKKISGALNTAGHAAEQGKEVFVMPGSIADPSYEGNNALLRDGAIPLIEAEDIFSAYSGRFEGKLKLNTQLSKAVVDGLKSALAEHSGADSRSTQKPKKEKSDNKNTAAPAKVVIKPEKAPKVREVLEFIGSQNAGKVLAAFREETELSDTLSARSGVLGCDFIIAVTELEIGGYITAVPVGRYKRN